MSFLKWLWSWFGGPKAPAPTLVVQVQAETVRLCGFLPAAQSVAVLIGAMTGQAATVATALGVATTICKAASKVPLGLAGDSKPLPVVEIDGQSIVIAGEYVKNG